MTGRIPCTASATGGDSGLFVVDAAAKTLGLDPNSDHSDGTYQVNVTSTGDFGTANHRMVSVMVTDTPPPQDTTPPEITINGPDNPATITVDSTYTDAGATCTDAVDGTRTVTTTGDSFSTATTRTHTVTYTCSDTSNNEATATRTVNVEATPDTTDPVITINVDNPATITVGST